MAMDSSCMLLRSASSLPSSAQANLGPDAHLAPRVDAVLVGDDAVRKLLGDLHRLCSQGSDRQNEV